MRIDIFRCGQTTTVKLKRFLFEYNACLFMSTVGHEYVRNGLNGLNQLLKEYHGWKKDYILAYYKYCSNKEKGIIEKQKPYNKSTLIIDPISRGILKWDYIFGLDCRLEEAKQEFLDYGFLMVEVQNAVGCWFAYGSGALGNEFTETKSKNNRTWLSEESYFPGNNQS